MRAHAFALLVLTTPAAAEAADAMAGQVQAASCAACHGLDGKSGTNPDAPALAGQHYDYLVKQIRDFRSGRRTSPIMNAIVGNMSDTNIEHVSKWYASLDMAEREGDGNDLGRTLYLDGDRASGLPPCAACHGDDALGRPGAGATGFPALRGQSVTYTTNQLAAFSAGSRSNDFGGMMGNIAGKLSEEQIAALAGYLATLDPPSPSTNTAVGAN